MTRPDGPPGRIGPAVRGYDRPVSDASPGTSTSLFRSLVNQVDRLWHEVAKFGIVGLCAFVIDVGLFNVLLYGGVLTDRPITAKIVSVVVATTFAYFANRYWTFRSRGHTSLGREYLLFFLLNGIAMAISVSCLWFSHYVMGWDSPLADNISANVVGLALGTLFRFWSYRRWVFPEDVEAADEAAVSTSA